MIKTNRGNCYITYVGDKVCYMYIGSDNIIYNPLLASTMKILIKNFPDKINEILNYINGRPELIPFINEDPMLVCSLGIEGLPIRWLVGDGAAWIETGLYATNNTYMKFKGSVPIGSDCGIFGCTYRDGDFYAMYVARINISKFQVLVKPSFANVLNNSTSGIHILEIDKTGFYQDNVKMFGANASTFTSEHTIGIFHIKNPYGGISNAKVLEFELKENNVKVLSMYPFVCKGVNGMIDTLTGTFYPNANSSGSFSIEYTLQDGATNWNPVP